MMWSGRTEINRDFMRDLVNGGAKASTVAD
jgi:hypothetical protein